MLNTHQALRANHERGHVAKAVVPYVPSWPLPDVARGLKPWACTFHDEPGGPKHFVAFCGRKGMERAVIKYLGSELHDGL